MDEKELVRPALFQPLEPPKRSPASIAVSVAVHAVIIGLAVMIPVATVNKVMRPHTTLTYLAPEPVKPYKPEKIVLPKIKTKIFELPPTTKPVVKLPEIKPIEPPKIIPPPEAPKVAINVPNPVPLPKMEPAPVRAAVKTNVFATPDTNTTNLGPKSPVKDVKTDTFGTQAAAAGAKSAAKTVQTGGFGDPNGVAPSKNSTNKGVVMAAFGSTELPVGGGKGGGNGRQVVGSAGFGGGFASAGPGGNGTTKGVVQSTGFGQSVSAGPAKKDSPSTPRETQVEILSKPKPLYTAEARELKVEGQVMVEVQFLASGSVKVLKVVKGLGHGLDESAQHAAAQIKFKPATRDGAAVDSTARVYIVFQLT